MIPAEQVYAIERPHPKLLTLYILRSFSFPPFSLIALPFLVFRYKSMRYSFDEHGVTMKWGVLVRREINLTYRRFQDIHITSGVVQRWLGLADIHIQTASGSAAAEMTIEGLLEYEQVRDFLYSRMRGAKGQRPPESQSAPAAAPSGGDGAAEEHLRAILAEMRAARRALESIAPPPGAGTEDNRP